MDQSSLLHIHFSLLSYYRFRDYMHLHISNCKDIHVYRLGSLSLLDSNDNKAVWTQKDLGQCTPHGC